MFPFYSLSYYCRRFLRFFHFRRFSNYYSKRNEMDSSQQPKFRGKLQCVGVLNSKNDILYSIIPNAENHTIFFQGDVQNLEDEMEDTEYIEYSLENTVRILEERTRHRSNIFVVRADRMNQSLSEWEMMLTPGRGIAHMAALLQNALEQLCTSTPNRIVIFDFCCDVSSQS